MAFKKLDSAAVDSTLSRPVDAFVAQGMDANVRAAWTARGRGAGKSYGADKRPTLASANVSCVPLSPWYVSPACTEITCKLRGLATSDGAGGIALNARLVAQTLGGIIYDDLDNATILDDASVQEKELTLDVAALEGEVIVVWLVFQSELITSSTASDDRQSSDVSNFNIDLDLGATIGATFDDSKRWQVTFAEDSSGVSPANSYDYPGPCMIIRQVSGNVVKLLPRMDERINSYPNFRVTITELGRFELYGWSLTETTLTEPAALTDALRPASVPRARTFSEIYRRERTLAAERTRVVHVGGSDDFETQGGGRFGLIVAGGRGLVTHEAYQALGGELPTYKVNTATATTVYRRRYRALALIAGAVSSAQLQRFKATAEITITDLGTGNTHQPTPTGAEAEVSTLGAIAPELRTDSGDRIFLFLDHHLHGTWSFADVVAGRHGLSLLDLTFEEASPAASTATRVIQVQITDEQAEGGGSMRGVTLVLYFPACTILVDEGF